MRIYLLTGQSIPRTKNGKPTGSHTIYGGEAFCEVPDELGNKWLKEGLAKKATKDNVVIEDDDKTPPYGTPAKKADKPTAERAPDAVVTVGKKKDKE